MNACVCPSHCSALRSRVVELLCSQEELIATEEQINERINKHRAVYETTTETIEEKVVRIHMHESAVNDALTELARIASENPEIKVWTACGCHSVGLISYYARVDDFCVASNVL